MATPSGIAHVDLDHPICLGFSSKTNTAHYTNEASCRRNKTQQSSFELSPSLSLEASALEPVV